jgi:hypothetical protein
MSNTPRMDEWYVTDTDCGTSGVFIKTRNDTICGIYGGKTIGEQYDIAARIAKLPDLECELTSITKQRDELAAQLREEQQLHTKTFDELDRMKDYVRPLEYWRGISECFCSNPRPQGRCLKCDLDQILDNNK